MRLSKRTAIATLLLFWIGAPRLWGGKEFPQNPGEQAVPNQLIVKLLSGVTAATAASVISSFLPGAQISNLVLKDHYLVRLPSGIPPGISTALAAHFRVDYVEPDRIRRVILAGPND